MITISTEQLLLEASVPTTHDPYLYTKVREAYSSSLNRGSKLPKIEDVIDELVGLFTMDSFYETRAEVSRSLNLPLNHPEVRMLAMEASTMASRNFCQAVEPTIEDILDYERLCFTRGGQLSNDPQQSIFDLMKGGASDEDSC